MKNLFTADRVALLAVAILAMFAFLYAAKTRGALAESIAQKAIDKAAT